MKSLIILITVLAVFTLPILLSACGAANNISINDYLDYSVSGYDGYGQASYSIDELALAEAIAEKILPKNDNISLESAAESVQILSALSQCSFDCSFDNSSNLSNGDKIKFTFNADFSPLKEKYNISITCNDFTVDVNDLSPIVDYDPFENIKITETGYSGIGTIYVESSDAQAADLNFTCNNIDGLKNGDSIKITVDTNGSSDINDYCKRNYGLNITRDSMDYTVSDLKEPEEFDPFDGLVITYDGVSDRGTVSVNGVKTEMPGLQFTASETEGLSNGQTITVSIVGEGQSEEEVWRSCLKNGLKPNAYEKEYTVEGLPWFAQELSEIPDEAKKNIIKNSGIMLRDRDNEAFYTIKAGQNKLNHANFRIDALDLIGVYFMVTTTGEEVVNQLVLIYQEDYYYEWQLIKGEVEATHNDRYYSYAVFTNIVLLNDKSDILPEFGEYAFCENITDNGITRTNDLAYFYGYHTEDEIYQQYVKSQDYKYIVEELDLSA